ncbi:MAG: hypothetical protein IJX44_08470 [Bacteroidaceae bacterium]|nr:hypothetical protein [Bacteroidaceae bacterium]
MEDINKTFTIQWVGPFHSLMEMNQYLGNTETCDEGLFSFYYFCGNKKGKGHKKNYFYRYFGIHKRIDSIKMRLQSRHEHFRDFIENENLDIWIGTFACEKNQMEQNIEDVETLFISTYGDYLTENDRKKNSIPRESICIINLWYKESENQQWIRKKPSINFFHDVLIYEKEFNQILVANLTQIKNQ